MLDCLNTISDTWNTHVERTCGFSITNISVVIENNESLSIPTNIEHQL